MLKKFLFIFLFISIFFLGMEVGVRKSFPYPELKFLKILLIGNDRVNSKLHYYKKRFAEFFEFKKTYHIVMLGDSITDRTDWNKLLDRDDILNRGISGDNTDGMLKRLDSFPHTIRVAFIMIGINDLGKGSSVEHIYLNYIKILTKLQKLAITPIIQSTLYVTYDTDNRKNRDIVHLNSLIMRYAIKHNIVFIDLNYYLSKNGHLCYQYSNDGIHLNRLGYKKWGLILKNYLKKHKI